MGDDKKQSSWNPTPEELAEADRFDEMCDALEQIGERFDDRFRPQWPLSYVEIMPQKDVDFRAYIFLESDSDVSLCESSGGCQAMRDFVHAQLANFGLGSGGEIAVAFEFDSRENVERNFQGSYLMRMT